MEIFISKLKSYINNLGEKKREKCTINNDMYYKMMNVSKSEDIDVSPKFKFWVYHTSRLMQIGSTDLIYNTKNPICH